MFNDPIKLQATLEEFEGKYPGMLADLFMRLDLSTANAAQVFGALLTQHEKNAVAALESLEVHVEMNLTFRKRTP